MFSIFIPGDHSEEETPVPIPNTAVKGLCGDGTVGLARGRVARRQVFFSGTPVLIDRGPFLFMGESPFGIESRQGLIYTWQFEVPNG